jgi:Spy/CpxP family protein refolding chaperone
MCLDMGLGWRSCEISAQLGMWMCVRVTIRLVGKQIETSPMERTNMRNTRKATLLLSALLATGAMFAQAQAVPADQQPTAQAPAGAAMHGPADPAKEARRMGKELGLTKDQVAQIQPILQDRVTQMQALRADTSLAPADRRMKAKGLMDDSKAKIEAVLNDQQKQQYEQMLANRKAKRQQQMQPPPAQQPGA